jgi:hypothetical protein
MKSVVRITTVSQKWRREEDTSTNLPVKARVVVPKLVCEVPDASGFGFVMSVDGCFSC